MRIALIRTAEICAVIVALVPLAGAVPATALPPPILARSIYVVRPDPRLCPSPLCGGYWVSLANRSRTRCHDGALRPRCYVAIAIDVLTRQPSTTGLPANGLVRAVIGSWPFDGFGELGSIFVAEVWKPAGSAPPTGDFFSLRDPGVRCIRAPCFSFRAARMNGLARMTLSSVDLQPARPTPDELSRAQAALTTPTGLFVLGRIVETVDGGRALRASRIYLRAARPRA